jgi:hypothetical protein
MRRSLTICAALAPLALLGAAVASATLPPANAHFEVHEHGTSGHDWHVELDVGRNRNRLKSVVLYLQECGETAFAQNVLIAADGSFNASGALTSGPGSWNVQGQFPDGDHAHGTYELTKPGCATGVRPFDAHRAGAGHHHHGAHQIVGNPAEYPDLTQAGQADVRRAQGLRTATVRASKRLDTLREARRAGYVTTSASRRRGCPGMHHYRKNGVRFWGRLMNPRAPQSLVFWCSSSNVYVLAAYMYRAPADSTPPTFGNLLQWHRHSDTGNWMTHIWIVPDTRAALASGAPPRRLNSSTACSTSHTPRTRTSTVPAPTRQAWHARRPEHLRSYSAGPARLSPLPRPNAGRSSARCRMSSPETRDQLRRDGLGRDEECLGDLAVGQAASREIGSPGVR